MTVEHECGICFDRVSQHHEGCDEPMCGGASHLPALCCPGCGCLSYEEAHLRIEQPHRGISSYHIYVGEHVIGTIRRLNSKSWYWRSTADPLGRFATTRRRAIDDMLMIRSRLMLEHA